MNNLSPETIELIREEHGTFGKRYYLNISNAAGSSDIEISEAQFDIVMLTYDWVNRPITFKQPLPKEIKITTERKEWDSTNY